MRAWRIRARTPPLPGTDPKASAGCSGQGWRAPRRPCPPPRVPPAPRAASAGLHQRCPAPRGCSRQAPRISAALRPGVHPDLAARGPAELASAGQGQLDSALGLRSGHPRPSVQLSRCCCWTPWRKGLVGFPHFDQRRDDPSWSLGEKNKTLTLCPV